MVRILLADDLAVVRRGLRVLFDARQNFKVCAEASNGREAVELALYSRWFVRGDLQEGRSIAGGVRQVGGTCARGDYQLPWAWRDGEAVFVRFFCGAKQRSADG